MEHSLKLMASLDLPGVEKIQHILRFIPGVRAVEAAAGSSQVHVQYDDGLTSPQEISTIVTRAGFPIEQPARRAGGCCGGCGGSGH
jgi:copper chaperone CopZ